MVVDKIDDLTMRRRQVLEALEQDRAILLPQYCALGIVSGVFDCLTGLVVQSLGRPAPRDLKRLVAGDAQQPCRYLRTAFERFGLAQDVEEHLVHYVFSDTLIGDEAQSKPVDAGAVSAVKHLECVSVAI